MLKRATRKSRIDHEIDSRQRFHHMFSVIHVFLSPNNGLRPTLLAESNMAQTAVLY